ncbi:elongation factor P hydroxylase [Colwelliaceae bacterium 6471]
MQHNFEDLIRIFNQTFAEKFNTQLVKGGDEPYYKPASDSCSYHQIIFARGYYASALHEIAHWCIAGKERRQLEDFGYWYIPDGRNEKQQQAFEQVEICPQAIEWAFCVAAQKKFTVSSDNLNGCGSDSATFKQLVQQQVFNYLSAEFPPQAQTFINALAQFYHTQLPLTREHFLLDDPCYQGAM